MRKIATIIALFLLLAIVYGCSSNKGIETKSTIVNKEIMDGNQYYFMVTYEIEGNEGLFEATIKIDSKATFDSYSIGDEYIFYRPSPK